MGGGKQGGGKEREKGAPGGAFFGFWPAGGLDKKEKKRGGRKRGPFTLLLGFRAAKEEKVK